MAQCQISPFFRSPMTDLTGGLISHQLLGRCGKMEMDMADCLEAYGLDRGLRKCKDLIEDFRECHTLYKQFNRFLAIHTERKRQIEIGMLPGPDEKPLWETPRIDSF